MRAKKKTVLWVPATPLYVWTQNLRSSLETRNLRFKTKKQHMEIYCSFWVSTQHFTYSRQNIIIIPPHTFSLFLLLRRKKFLSPPDPIIYPMLTRNDVWDFIFKYLRIKFFILEWNTSLNSIIFNWFFIIKVGLYI